LTKENHDIDDLFKRLKNHKVEAPSDSFDKIFGVKPVTKKFVWRYRLVAAVSIGIVIYFLLPKDEVNLETVPNIPTIGKPQIEEIGKKIDSEFIEEVISTPEMVLPENQAESLQEINAVEIESEEDLIEELLITEPVEDNPIVIEREVIEESVNEKEIPVKQEEKLEGFDGLIQEESDSNNLMDLFTPDK
jgi:hypothetical protein